MKYFDALAARWRLASAKASAGAGTFAMTAMLATGSVYGLALSGGAQAASDYRTIEWTDLMPAADLDALMAPPAWIDEVEDGSPQDIMDPLKSPQNSPLRDSENSGAGSKLTESQQQDKRYAEALKSAKIRPEFDGQRVRIPGFIVPLESTDDQTLTSFFIVPYFGACIHVPPPPPNQIIYSKFPQGFKLTSLYDAFWIEGTIKTELITNDIAEAAYTLDVNTIEPYLGDE